MTSIADGRAPFTSGSSVRQRRSNSAHLRCSSLCRECTSMRMGKSWSPVQAMHYFASSHMAAAAVAGVTLCLYMPWTATNLYLCTQCTQIVEQFRRPECQKLHGYMHMKGAGRSNGEPHENLNAFLGPLGRISMYMSRYNRQVSQADCEGVNVVLP